MTKRDLAIEAARQDIACADDFHTWTLRLALYGISRPKGDLPLPADATWALMQELMRRHRTQAEAVLDRLVFPPLNLSQAPE